MAAVLAIGRAVWRAMCKENNEDSIDVSVQRVIVIELVLIIVIVIENVTVQAPSCHRRVNLNVSHYVCQNNNAT